jgi:hypothetical protein
MRNIVTTISMMICMVFVGKAQSFNKANFRTSYSVQRALPDTSKKQKTRIVKKSDENKQSFSNQTRIEILRDLVDSAVIDVLHLTTSNDTTLFKQLAKNPLPEIRKRIKKEKKVENIDTLTALRDSIKLDNTDALLHPKRTTIFSIGHLGNYNIDSLKKNLFGQVGFSLLDDISYQKYSGIQQFLNSNLASMNMGPLNVGIGASLNIVSDTTKDSTQKKSNIQQTNIKKLMVAGGAINLNFTLPIFLVQSPRNNYHLGLYAQTMFGFLPYSVDTSAKLISSNDFSMFNQSGFALHLDGYDNVTKGKISADISYHYVSGSERAYTQLGTRDFSVIRLHIGVTLDNTVALHLTGPLYSSNKLIQDVPFTLTLAASPSQIIKSNK